MSELDGQFWLDEIAAAKSYFEDWQKTGDRVVERYRDEKRGRASRSRFNILWSNIKTWKPAVYSRRPNPEVTRRHKDKDAVGNLAAQILERAMIFESEQYADVHQATDKAVDDELLIGRGTAWGRMEGQFEEVQTESVEGDPEKEPDEVEPETEEVLAGEYAPIDYVYWKDFLHSPGRVWSEVRWVARRTFLTRAKLVKRFGEKGETAPLTHTPEGYDKKSIARNGETLKQAVVWEIWHKESKKVFWVAEAESTTETDKSPVLLDERDDFLNLDNFFPCPKPLSMSMDGGSLIPVPDYVHYEDQAKELDNLTYRIDKIQSAIRANAVYNGAEKSLLKLQTEENAMIPVLEWAGFAERGGIKGNVEWIPVDMLVSVLATLQQAREATKQTIYEITGLSDVIRGSSQASETATAQRIKGQFASLRLTERQSAVAEFASEAFRIKAEIMATKYRPETLIEMSSAHELIGLGEPPQAPQMPNLQMVQDPQQAQQMQQQSQQAMQQYQKAMQEYQGKLQMLQQAIELLQSEPGRQFRIEVNADSFVQLDEQEEKDKRTEFLGAMGTFLNQAMPLLQAQPAMGPMIAEMIGFAAKSFKVGRQLEPAIEQAMQQIQGPSPQQMQQQLEQQKQQQDQEHKKAMGDLAQQKKLFDAEKGLMTKDVELTKREAVLGMKEAAMNLSQRAA